MPVQADLGVSVDDGNDRVVQLLLGDVALVDEGDLTTVEIFHGTRGLRWAETAAIAERGGEVTLTRTVELGVETRERAEVPGPTEPVFGIGERLQDADGRHALFEQPLQALGALRFFGAQAFYDGLAANDLDVLILGKGPIDCGRGFGKLGFQTGDECLRVRRDAGLFGVGGDIALIFLPRDELVTVIAIFLAARDAEVAGLEFVDHLREQADLEVASVDLDRPGLACHLPGQQRPPLFAHEGEIKHPARDVPTLARLLHNDPQLGVAMCAMR